VTTPLPVLPQIIAEAGFTSTAPVVPAGTFILNDATNGKLDTDMLGGGITWQDISPYVLGFTITRPATREAGPLWQWQAATASITLDNSAGIFEPDNTAGPYYGQLTAMVPVRIRAVWNGTSYGLFSGFADGWMPAQVTYEGGYAELTLPCTDAFKVLGGITLPATAATGAGETTGARVNRILNSAMWYTTADYRQVSTGNSTVQATFYGDSALNLMQVTTASEIGQLYIDGTGRAVFRQRQALLSDSRSNSVQAAFGDLPGTVHPSGSHATSSANNFEGGTDGSAITAAGSGGASGLAFDIISTSGGGTVTWSSTHAAHGTLAGACTTANVASAAQFGYSSAILVTAQPQLWTRFYVYLSALPAAADSLMRFGNGGGSTLLTKISIGTTGKVTVGAVTSSWSLPTAQWVRIEANLTFPGDSTAAFTLNAWLSPDSGSADYQLTGSAQTFGAVAGCNDVRWGQTNSAASNYTAWFDDIDVNSTGWAGPATRPALTELAVAAISRASDDTTIANDIQATITGSSNLQEVQDAASILAYRFPRSYARSDLILQDDPTAKQWAGWVLYISKTGEDRFESVAVDPQADTANLWTQALSREIGDRIQVWHRPASAPAFAKDCFVGSISHAWNSAALSWLTTWTLQDASRYGSFLTLDNAPLGQLGYNALAF